MWILSIDLSRPIRFHDHVAGMMLARRSLRHPFLTVARRLDVLASLRTEMGVRGAGRSTSSTVGETRRQAVGVSI